MIKILNRFESKLINPTKTFYLNDNINLEFDYQIDSDQPVSKLTFDLPVDQKTKQLEPILSHTDCDFQQNLQVQKLALKTILNPNYPFSKWFNTTCFNFFNSKIKQVATTKGKEL